MRKIKIGVLSLYNGHARMYFSFLRTSPLFDLVGVSVSPENRSRAFLHKLPGVPVYPTDEALLDAHPELEAAVIAGPNYQNLERVRLCASRGLHIYMMKVPTMQMDEYSEMQSIVKESGVIFQVELQMRFIAMTRRLRQLIQDGAVGNLKSIHATNLTHCIASWFTWVGDGIGSYGKDVPIRPGDPRLRGGALTDHPHIFDMMRFLTDSEYEYVYADCAPNLRDDLRVEDMVFILGRMKNGVMVSLDPSYSRLEHPTTPLGPLGPGWEQYPRRVEVNYTVTGDKGVILVDCYNSGMYHTANPHHAYTMMPSHEDYHFERMMADFHRCICEKQTPFVTLDSHRATIEVMNACYESISRGEPVYL